MVGLEHRDVLERGERALAITLLAEHARALPEELANLRLVVGHVEAAPDDVEQLVVLVARTYATEEFVERDRAARVTIERAVVSATSEGADYVVDYDRGRVKVDWHDADSDVTWVYDDGCLTATGVDDGEKVGGDTCSDDEDGEFFALFEGEDTLPPLRVVQVDGQWYVSPTRSVLGVVVDALKGIDREQLDKATEFFGSGDSVESFDSSESGDSGEESCVTTTLDTVLLDNC